MIQEFIMANSSIFVGGFVVFIGYIAGLYIKYKIEMALKAPKQGTKQGCESCLAMQAFTERIPIIEGNQLELRRTSLPVMAEDLTILKTDVKTIQDNVDKLFNLIEQSWLAQINRLETTLHQSMCFPVREYEKLKLIQEKGKRKNDTGKGRSRGSVPKPIQKALPRAKKGGGK